MCTRSPDVDGIKIFNKDDQAARHCSIKEQCFAAWSSLSKILIPSTSGDLVHTKYYRTMFCGLVIFIKNFDPINIRRPCAHKITMFCSEVMMIKSFNPIKSRRPWPPISISHLFQQGPFSSSPLLFLHLGCFCLDFTSFF